MEKFKKKIKKQMQDLRSVNTSFLYHKEIEKQGIDKIVNSGLANFIYHARNCMQNNVIIKLYKLFEKKYENNNFSLHEVVEFLEENRNVLDNQAEENFNNYNKLYNENVIYGNTDNIILMLKLLIQQTEDTFGKIKKLRNASAHPKSNFMLNENRFIKVGLTEEELENMISSCDCFYNRLFIFVGMMPEGSVFLQKEDLKIFLEMFESDKNQAGEEL